MKSIFALAVTGTGQQDIASLVTAPPLDALIAETPTQSTEQKVLLTAGALALYQQAGRVADIAPELPVPAKPETLPVCSESTVRVLQDIVQGKHQPLLLEALTKIQQIGVRLPHELLPTMLDLGTRKKELRPVLVMIVDERGRWLGHMHPSWSWVVRSMLKEQPVSDQRTIHEQQIQAQEQHILDMFAVGKDMQFNDDWISAIEHLPVPWRHSFSLDYLDALRQRLQILAAESRMDNRFILTMNVTARSIPPECLDSALLPWEFSAKDRWMESYFKRVLDEMMEIVHLRKRIMKEIV